MKKLLFFLFFAFICFLNTAHIGSPAIVMESDAGPYKLSVFIRPPEVVPGTADVSIRSQDKDIQSISVQPVYFRHGGEKAPTPDVLIQVPGQPGLFTGLVWLMVHGSSSIKITVKGLKGEGATVIPIPALATAQLSMDKGLQTALLVLMSILFIGGATILAACVGEGILPVGQKVNSRVLTRSVLMGMLGMLLLGLILYFGRIWWLSEERKYNQYMYKPSGIANDVISEGKEHFVKIKLLDEGHLDRKPGDLIPDHGKMMHIFIVSEKDHRYFAHIHPSRVDSLRYQARLPEGFPPGTYRVFTDLVHESGLGETLLTTLTFPGRKITQTEKNLFDKLQTDPDDSFFENLDASKTSQILPGKVKVTRLDNKKLLANLVQNLAFAFENEQGLPVALEPYLGMTGHLVVLKKDESVFIHLHPIGTISMAAQEALAKKISDPLTLCSPYDAEALNDSLFKNTNLLDQQQLSTIRSQVQERMKKKGLTDRVAFPYAFPKTGSYRLWLQVKYSGKIQTAAFDVEVEAQKNL